MPTYQSTNLPPYRLPRLSFVICHLQFAICNFLRQLDDEPASCPRLALDHDLTAVGLHCAAHDGQPQANSLAVTNPAPVEPLEDVFPVGRGDTWATILDPQPHLPASPFGTDLNLPTDEEQCVESAEWMKANHMDLLIDWREEVVRDGARTYTASDGKEYTKSLTDSCLDCHSPKAEFCDRCHDYVGTSPNCWNCHIDPEGSLIYGN